MLFHQFTQYVEMFVKMYPQLTALFLIFAKILGAILLIPATPITILSGTLLGTFWGTIVSMIGNTIGAVLAFLIGRYFFQNWVQKKFLPKYPKIRQYEHLFFSKGFSTVLFMRLVPLFPFNAINYLLGITKVSLRDYFWATLLGILPGTFVYVYLGDSIRMISFFKIFLFFTLLGLLSLIPKFWQIKR